MKTGRLSLNAVRNDAAAKVWIDRELETNLALPFCGYAITDGNGKQVGAFVFNNYSGADVELTIACSERVTIRVARFIALLAFYDLGARRLSAKTRVSNHKAIHAMGALGFKVEGCAREYFDGEDAVLFGLLESEQKLVKRK